MGKSDKKIRADSINNLRKRYDAFLEEDRKRKERNEDIIAKLDKMRNSVTRYKANVYLDQRLPINRFGDASRNPVRRYNETQMSEVDVLTKHIDETHLLSQISKKYILIPKLRSIDNDYIPRAIQQDNNSNDNDWKSKYSILDKLKQNEKEDTINPPAFTDRNIRNYENLSTELPKYTEDEPVKLSVKRENIKGMNKDLEVNEFNAIPRSHQQETGEAKSKNFIIEAEKDIPEESETQWPEKTAITDSYVLKSETEFTKTNENVDNDFISGMDVHYQQQPDSDASLAVPKISTHVQNFRDVNDHEEIEPVPYQNLAEQQNNFGETTDKHEIEDTEKTYPGDEDITHVEVLHPDELVQQISNENAGFGSHANIGGFQETDYPIDIINVQEFTPGNNVNLVDGVNINPEGHAVEQEYIPPSHQYVPETITVAEQEKDGAYQDPVNVYPDEQITNEGNYDPSQQYETIASAENVDITSGIQEFETEQNEMYYSEQANAQNYDQYNQGEVVDVYNADYTGSMETYDPSAYYDGAQQGGAYPVEVNEHEETSQRYDPSYEQQYATTNEEQNQYVEHLQSQQENLDVLEPVEDAVALEYDPEQYAAEQQIAEHVEQQLDREDGYVQENLGGNISDKVDEAILYQQAFHDQTLEQNPENQAIPAVES